MEFFGGMIHCLFFMSFSRRVQKDTIFFPTRFFAARDSENSIAVVFPSSLVLRPGPPLACLVCGGRGEYAGPGSFFLLLSKYKYFNGSIVL